MIRPRRALLGGLAVAAICVGVTLLALEGGEVVVVRTRGPDGAQHTTRTWIADHDGYAWLEAANPERPFYADICAHPDVVLRRGGVDRLCIATPIATTKGHGLIRHLLHERYGLADCWIGLLADTSRSLAIRLECR